MRSNHNNFLTSLGNWLERKCCFNGQPKSPTPRPSKWHRSLHWWWIYWTNQYIYHTYTFTKKTTELNIEYLCCWIRVGCWNQVCSYMKYIDPIWNYIKPISRLLGDIQRNQGLPTLGFGGYLLTPTFLTSQHFPRFSWFFIVHVGNIYHTISKWFSTSTDF